MGLSGGVIPCHGDCAYLRLQEILYPTLNFLISRCLAEGRTASSGRVRCQATLRRHDAGKKNHLPRMFFLQHVQVAMTLIFAVLCK